MSRFFPFIFVLILIAAILQDDFVFTIIYLIVGVYALGRWWGEKALSGISYNRHFVERAFLGEQVKVELELINAGWLPLPWIRVQEGLPVELRGAEIVQRVLSLSSKGKKRLEYILETRKRGYYPIGPLFLSTGDVLGMIEENFRREGGSDYLTVYPKIIPLVELEFPSRSPLGSLRHKQPIFEDPSRILGKRDYVVGDSLRRLDWKATANTGRLQVKLFEPSIELETIIFLNLNRDDYHYRSRIDATELAIVITASVANWVVGKKQMVGLCVNGVDPLVGSKLSHYIPPRKGQMHLMQILEVLARIKMGEGTNFSEMIQQKRFHLPWGTTMFVVTSRADNQLLDELFKARQTGMNAVIVLVGPTPASQETTQKAAYFNIPVIHIERERDLEIWRK